MGTEVPEVTVYELVAEGQEDTSTNSANTSMAMALGDDFTVMSVAEHVNYLLLNWYFKQNASNVYTAPNVVLVDFVHPVLVHRIIESMQGVTDCGFAQLCNDTGSCNAKSMLRRSEQPENGGDDTAGEEVESVEEKLGGECMSEEQALSDLATTEADRENFSAALCLGAIACCMCGVFGLMWKGSSTKAEGDEEEMASQKDLAMGEGEGAIAETASQQQAREAASRRGSARSGRAPVFGEPAAPEAAAVPPSATATAEGVRAEPPDEGF